MNRIGKIQMIRIMLCVCVIGLLFLGMPKQLQAAVPTYQMTQSKKTMVIGSSYQFKVNVKNATVSWSSSRPKVATVSKTGKVTAKRAGNTTLRAKVKTADKTTVYRCKIVVVTQQKAYETQVIKLINKERRKYGYPSFNQNYYLQKAAQKRAKEIGETKYSVVRPNGYSFTSAISMSYDFEYAAQSIACDFATPKGVVDAWMENKNTKANIISKRYDDIGVGVYLSEDGYLYWVAIYGRKK